MSRYREDRYVWDPDDNFSVGIQVQGRLKQTVDYWEQVLKAPQYITQSIQEGYMLPLFSVPSPYMSCNHRSTLEQKEFATSAVVELLATNCILKMDDKPSICSPLSVVDGHGKERLVINLRHLNSFLWKQKFKYEDLRTALLLFEKVIRHLHLILNLDIIMWKFTQVVGNISALGGIWEGSKHISYSKFCLLGYHQHVISLPSCYAPWRGHGFRVVVYLDDGICSVEADRAEAASKFLQDS